MEQLFTLPDITIRYMSSNEDWTTEREESLEDIVWVLVLEGKIGIGVDAFEYRLQDSESIVIQPNQSFRLFADSTETTYVSFRFAASRLNGFENKLNPTSPPVAVMSTRKLLGEWSSRWFLGIDSTVDVMTFIQHHLSDSIVDENIFAPVLRVIHDSYHTELRIEELSRIVHQSKYQFIRSFRERIGQTPYQYITRQRLIHAKSLLRYSDLTLLAISQEVGFNSPAQLNKHFAEWVGCTPARFRENKGHHLKRD
ncbi:helix-turn-helix domain-containing protein [Exiguobacterium aestuarii]|uniref:Helix-turn-helix domain-containing protein n=1 Tax=Exiguobacterium aestuarii TaxID=273527 RepID=A0ABW2PQK3_9BACL|nr:MULTISPECIES: AraC family transcriptional regulator [Exiguobacterium]MCT4784800.1 AraC family transcriptional regulator [Exiguobacterium aestuarii]